MAELYKTVKGMARIMYDVPDGEEPTKAQTNHVAKLCREGKLDAAKAGVRWVIRMEFAGGDGR